MSRIMSDDTFAQLVPYLIIVVLTAIPALILFGRTGLSRWWALLSLVPLGMIVILWVVALRHWPVTPAWDRPAYE